MYTRHLSLYQFAACARAHLPIARLCEREGDTGMAAYAWMTELEERGYERSSEEGREMLPCYKDLYRTAAQY